MRTKEYNVCVESVTYPILFELKCGRLNLTLIIKTYSIQYQLSKNEMQFERNNALKMHYLLTI